MNPMNELTQQRDPERLAKILPLLACPACRGWLRLCGPHALQCQGCEASYPVRQGVPILLPANMQEAGVGFVDSNDPVSRHPYSPNALEIIESSKQGWVLDLGAGGKLLYAPHVLQVDIFRYPMTDVVATADCLPFRDNAFRAVLSQAVFEHLQYPEAAAAEIRRVLQPHGVLRIDTAFLQPEHGYPHHFYNATETGLRHWFRDFDIEWSGVDTYQHPKWALSWFLDVYTDRMDAGQAALLRTTEVGSLLKALQRSAAGTPELHDLPVLQALDSLPAHELRTLAAGVSIQARNPAKTFAPAHEPAAALGPPGQLQHEPAVIRELIAVRQEVQNLQTQLATAHEAYAVAVDRGNYMAQWAFFELDLKAPLDSSFKPRLRFAMSAIARLLLAPDRWMKLRAAAHSRGFALPRGQQKTRAQEPFFTIIVAPAHVSSFIKVFFALTHQTYTAWELMVLEYPGQPAGVRYLLHDLLLRDERVRALNALGDSAAERLTHAHTHARGQYVLNLPEDAVPVHRALQTVYTVLRSRPATRTVVGDLEHAPSELSPALRCYGLPLVDAPVDGRTEFSFVFHAKPGQEGRDEVAARLTVARGMLVHIPEVLFRQTASHVNNRLASQAGTQAPTRGMPSRLPEAVQGT